MESGKACREEGGMASLAACSSVPGVGQVTQSDAPEPQDVPGKQEAQVGYEGVSFHSVLTWDGGNFRG